jgi:L-lactate utilization protein LutB
MNTCPVYRRSGGLSYGATYSGPIGLIIDPTFNKRKYSNLPFASTLNGSCSNVCPVPGAIFEPVYLCVKERSLPGFTEQSEMSQGMFRALSTFIHVSYGCHSAKSNLLLIDDIGEGWISRGHAP